jgi:XTP/dITP diphosphohydrolase
MKLERGSRLVIATHNEGKVREFRTLLAPFGLELVSAGQLGLAEPIEDGTTYGENARIKADAAAQASGLPALSDDSGLCVFDLWGAPGLFSARWAGPNKDFSLAMVRIKDELELRGIALSSRPRAAFVAALCLSFPNGERIEVEGACEGHIVWPPRGSLGFGYDPVFQPQSPVQNVQRESFELGSQTHTCTFGEMAADTKHSVNWPSRVGLSHRARAFIALAERVFEKV